MRTAIIRKQRKFNAKEIPSNMSFIKSNNNGLYIPLMHHERKISKSTYRSIEKKPTATIKNKKYLTDTC